MARLPVQPGETKPHLSASAIDAYRKCALAYKLDRIDKVTGQSTWMIAFGRAAHKAVAEDGQSRIDLGAGLPLADLESLFQAELAKELIGIEDLPVTLAELHARGHNALKAYLTEVAPHLRLFAVELPFRVELALPFDLVGVIDYVERLPHGDRIGDYKFTKSYREWDTTTDGWVAGAIYALGWASLNGGVIPVELNLTTIQHLKTMAHVKFWPATRSIGDIYNVIDLAKKVARAIGNDLFEPTGYPGACRYCQVRKWCKVGGEMAASDDSEFAA